MSTRSRSRRSSRGGRGPKPVLQWENLIFKVPLAAGANLAIADLTREPMSASLVGTAGTIIRLILRVRHMLLSTSEVPITVVMGITLMTIDAFTALASPDPIGDQQQPWYWWDSLTMVRDTNAAPQTDSRDFDIRTSRKVRSGWKLVLVSETDAGNHPSATDLDISVRALWRLP